MSTNASARIGPVLNIPRPLTPKAPLFAEKRIDCEFSSLSTAELSQERLAGYQVALLSMDSDAPMPGTIPQKTHLPHLLLLPLTWLDLLEHLHGETARAQLECGGEVAQFGEVLIDFLRHEARRADQPIELTPMEFRVLKFFNSNPYRVISRGELLEKVWGYECYPSTRTVDNHIFNLRRKLERAPANPTQFQTIHGVGYKFVPCETRSAVKKSDGIEPNDVTGPEMSECTIRPPSLSRVALHGA